MTGLVPGPGGTGRGSDAAGEARVLARFETGDPAIVEKAVGKGTLFVFASGWQPGDSPLGLPKVRVFKLSMKKKKKKKEEGEEGAAAAPAAGAKAPAGGAKAPAGGAKAPAAKAPAAKPAAKK